MAESEAVAALRTSIARYLRDSFDRVETDSDGDFVVTRGSARVFVRPLEQEDLTLVVIGSITNLGVSVEGGLTRFLATENAALSFGKFGLNEEAGAVQLVHTLLGDFLNREELAVAVEGVAEAADEYDDEIKERFGGRLFSEVPEGLAELLAAANAIAQHAEDAGPPDPSPRFPTRLQAVFGGLALLGAIVGAVYAYDLEESIWLSVFVAVLAFHVVGRAAADLVTDPDKARRALYFLLFPALATALLAGSYLLWEEWWASTLIGLIGGGILQALIAPRLFGRVHSEETADSMRRLAGLGG